ncbi:peptidoglycan DD-metalloendopeptidase family protein [Pseudoclavibacter sp. JSM 162008]|uniref:M23 family metallopeptidase n=1 Tax=Pseudoclavibacter sp. JSM 162008 TaxID=3229855 RepID=UPI003525CD25
MTSLLTSGQEQAQPAPMTRRELREAERLASLAASAPEATPEAFTSRRARREAERTSTPVQTAPVITAALAPQVVSIAEAAPVVSAPAPAPASIVTPSIAEVAQIRSDETESTARIERASVAVLEVPLSFARNEQALRPEVDSKTGRRGLVRVKNSESSHKKRGALLRGAAGVTALGFAATIAVVSTMPANATSTQEDQVAGDSAAALADAVSSVPGQTLTVSGGEGTTVEREDAYAVTTMGSATAANLMSLVDRGTYKNDLSSTVQWPFPVGVAITDDFGPRVSPGGIGSTNHMGIDFAPAQGTPIGSIAGGTVKSVTPTDNGGLGVHVIVEHVINGQSYESVYGHMLTGSISVKVGDVVKVGDELGKVGNTGASTGPHLHLEVHTADGNKIDPIAFLTQFNVVSTVVTMPGESAGA